MSLSNRSVHNRKDSIQSSPLTTLSRSFMATQPPSRTATPALFHQFQGPLQRAFSGDPCLQQSNPMNMMTIENDADVDIASNDPSSSSRKRSGDALAYPRKRATIAVISSARTISYSYTDDHSANSVAGESHDATVQDQGASYALNYASNVSTENRESSLRRERSSSWRIWIE